MSTAAKPVNTAVKVTAADLDNNDLSKAESAVLAAPSMILGRLGFGGLLGLCSGYAIKQASKALAVVVGGAVVFLQSLQYCGYIEVKWSKIQADAQRALSADGQGSSLGVKDVQYWLRKMMRIITHQGPTAGGFAAGIYIGLQM